MNATELLNILQIPKTKDPLTHATKLLSIYSLLKSVKSDIISVEVSEKTEMMFGKKTEWDIHWNELRTVNEGYKIAAEKITVKTSYGEYNFTIPVNNDFHSLVYNLLQISVDSKKETLEVIETFEIEKTVLDKIKIAAKYLPVKNDYPIDEKFKGILINIENQYAEVTATNCYKLYLSEKMLTDGTDKKLLINPNSLKAIAEIKPDSDFVTFQLLKPEKNNQFVLINGVKIELMNEVYADYKSIIPTYSEKMIFNRKEFISNIRKVLLSANKYSHLVKLYLNGTIEISAHDVDFKLESVSKMYYETKEFDDLTIGFDGLLIQDVLNTFKSEQISMLTDGNTNKAVLFTDGVDTSLLMPMNLNK